MPETRRVLANPRLQALSRAKAFEEKGQAEDQESEGAEAVVAAVRMPDGTTVAPADIVYEKVGDQCEWGMGENTQREKVGDQCERGMGDR